MGTYEWREMKQGDRPKEEEKETATETRQT